MKSQYNLAVKNLLIQGINQKEQNYHITFHESYFPEKIWDRFRKKQPRYQHLVFILTDVEDYQTLINGMKPGYEVILLDAFRNGIEEITQTLASRSDIESIHIVSHGSPGVVNLGLTQLSAANFDYYSHQLRQWRISLNNHAAICLYGCHVADDSNPHAIEFLYRLSELTGANVAASTNLTGSAELGGDWDLEFSTGEIADNLPFEVQAIEDYQSILPEIFVTETFTDRTIDGNWIFGKGLDTSESPKLTAAPANEEVVTGLFGTGEAIEGEGVLRLSENSTNQSTFAINNDPFPSGAGLNITFDFFTYGGTGADGFSFFLIDGNESPTTAGAFGGSLGYAQKQTSNAEDPNIPAGIPGIVGGYLGIGFDEFGNFANDLEKRVGASNNLNAQNRLPDAVTIRGSEATNYNYLTDSGTLPSSLDSATATKRTVQIQLTADNIISVAIDFNEDGDFEDANEAVITNFDVSANNGPLPETLKFGFGASTGGQTNFHELQNVQIQSIDPVADLVTTKTGPTSVLNGDTITYTITTTNNGPDEADQVAITDELIAGLSNVLVSDGGTYDSSTGLITWPTINSLANDASVTRTISFTAPDPDNIPSITDIARSTSETPFDSDTSNNNDTFTTTINPSADLAVTKTVNNSTPNPGDEIVYTITVTNNGPDDATNVAIDDDLPDGLTYVSDNSGGFGNQTPTYNVANGIWTVGTLANGETATLQITATVNADANLGSLTNTAEIVSLDQSDVDDSNNDSSAAIAVQEPTIDPPRADLQVSKTVDNSTPNPGDEIVYTIQVKNNGPDDATNVVLDDDLPTGVTYISDNSGGLGNPTPTYNVADGTWNVGNLANGETKTLEITVRVDANIQGTTIANVARVSSSGITDPNPDNNQNNQQSAAIAVQNPLTDLDTADLQVSKTVDNPTPNPGEAIVYTITVTNNGPDDATNVAIDDDLPSGLTYVSDNTPTGTYNSTNGNWNLDTLANGETATLQITARVNSGTERNEITNRVQLIGSNQRDSDPTNNQEDVTIAVRPAADLAVTKTVDNVTPNPGETIVYTIAVTNNGPDDATNVAIDDDLPDGLTYVSDNSGGFGNQTPTYNVADGTWTVGSLANGETATLQITATVNADANLGSLTNTAEIVSVDQSDVDDSNNDSSAAIAVQNPTADPTTADLQVSKSVNNPTPNPGEAIVYTITVTNIGPNNATGLVLDDDLPAGLTYISDNSGGFGFPTPTYNVADGTWTVGSLGKGETATLQITAIVNPGTERTNIENLVEVTAIDQIDRNITNNEAKASIAVRPSAELEVNKTVNNSNPAVGETIVYTIAVTNNGPDDATNVAIDDDLPRGLTYVSDNSGDAYDLSSGLWTVGTLANGDTAILQITATVNADADGSITNTAEVFSVDQSDIDATNDRETAEIVVASSTTPTPPTPPTPSTPSTPSTPPANPSSDIINPLPDRPVGIWSPNPEIVCLPLPPIPTVIFPTLPQPPIVTFTPIGAGPAVNFPLFPLERLGLDAKVFRSPLGSEFFRQEFIETRNQRTLLGSLDDDRLFGADEANLIMSDAGNDTLRGGNGSDRPVGPELDRDRLEGGKGDDRLNGNQGNDSLYGGKGNDVVNGGKDNDWISGDDDNDLIWGDLGNDTISGGNGRGLVTKPLPVGSGQQDLIFGNRGNDLINGNEGNDTIYSGKNDDIAYGGKDDDLIYGDRANDTIIGDLGNDSLFGGVSDITVGDSEGRDLVIGKQGHDFLNGNENNDTVFGNQGNDTAHGGKDNDVIYGNQDNDLIYGDLGNDTISGGNGRQNPVGRGQDDDRIFGNRGNDLLNGNEGNDTIYSGKDDDIAYGGKDNDVIYGDRANDTIIGDLGNDSLFGGVSDMNVADTEGRDLVLGKQGDDFLNGNENNDTVSGGEGNDTAHGGKNDDRIFGNQGNDLIFGDLGNDTISGGNGRGLVAKPLPVGSGKDDDRIFGNRGNDLINGNEGQDTIYAGKDHDIVHGGKDQDLIYGDRANDTIMGDRGNDILFGGVSDMNVADTEGRDLLYGLAGDDFLNGNENNDTVSGGEGNDTAHGGKDNDVIYGNEGSDLIFGDLGNDTITGGNGSKEAIGSAGEQDILFGNRGNDIINGNEGEDTIYAGQDRDLIYGGKDNDVIYGDRANDTIMGDRGNDTIFGGVSDIAVGDRDGRDFLDGGDGDDFLNGNENNDTLSGGEGNDIAYGGKDHDLIHGDAGNDFLSGDLGNDSICGGLDNDTLIGGDGDDFLAGDIGSDSLVGGAGSDVFVLNLGGGLDIIADYQDGVDAIGLFGSLTFDRIAIAQGSNTTLILGGGQILGHVIGLQANSLTQDDFILLG